MAFKLNCCTQIASQHYELARVPVADEILLVFDHLDQFKQGSRFDVLVLHDSNLVAREWFNADGLPLLPPGDALRLAGTL